MATTNGESSRLCRAAVKYARRGWYVFPLKPRDKVPLTAHGFKDATNDPEVVRATWEKQPDANIGLVPGPSGLVVIDADGPEGRQSLQDAGLLSEPTLTVTTGRGIHRYYRRPAGDVTANDIGPGTTVRCDRGYVVVPPSIHPSGTRYEWEKSFEGISEFPPRALALLCGQHEAPQKPATAAPIPDVIHEGEGRNNFLTSLAGTMRRRGLTATEILAALREPNQGRCRPPLDDTELEGIARSVGRYEPAAPVTGTPNAAPVPIRLLSDILADPEAMQPPEAVVPYLAYRGRVTELVAVPKFGKSTLATAGAAALSRGAPFLGQPTKTSGTALWYSADLEAEPDIARRFQFFGCNPTRIHVLATLAPTPEAFLAAATTCRPDLLVIDTLAGYAGSVVTDPFSSAQWTPLMQRLTAWARETRCAVLLLHHGRKSDGKARDSNAIEANVDAVMEFVNDDRGDDGTLRRIQVRARWPVADFAVRLDGRAYVLEGAGELSLETRVLLFVESHPGCTQRQVRDGVTGNATDKSTALRALWARGAIDCRPEGKTQHYYPTSTFVTGTHLGHGDSAVAEVGQTASDTPGTQPGHALDTSGTHPVPACVSPHPTLGVGGDTRAPDTEEAPSISCPACGQTDWTWIEGTWRCEGCARASGGATA